MPVAFAVKRDNKTEKMSRKVFFIICYTGNQSEKII